MALSWRFGACSDIGRTRKRNDDSAYAGPHLLVVADGMGGAAAGDLASTVAVETLQRLDENPPDDLLESLAGTLHRANDRLAELIETDPSIAGMGTTVTAVLFDGERIGVAHLGDSRGYLWRNGELLRLTSDHTWVQTLVDEGRITEAEARVHSHRSLLLKVLDGQHHHDPDLMVYELQAGDRVLLCSDGLTGFVGPGPMAEAFSRSGTAESLAEELTRVALKAGSNDNVTVVVADVVDTPSPSASPIVVGAAADPVQAPRARLRQWPRRDGASAGKSLVTDPDFDPEELRYAPRPPRRLAVLRRLAVFVLLAAVAAGAGLAAYHWSQQQYYVAPYGQQVAIYRGVQATVPVVPLHTVYHAEPLLLSELPSFRRSQVVDGMPADSLQHARRIIGNLKSFARACARLVSRTAGTTTPTGQPTTPRTAPPTSPTSGPTSPRTPTASASPGSPGHSATSSSHPRPQHSATTSGPHHHLASQATTAKGHPAPSPSAPISSSPSTQEPTPETARECAGATPATTPAPASETSR